MIVKGKRILITAGPTYEALDPVRFIGNHSTGKMGIALAQIAQELGAHVTLILGPSKEEVPEGVTLVRVVSAIEMYEEVKAYYPTADVIIFSAAVADYKPKYVHDQKIKKSEAEYSLELVKNIDIAQTLGDNKGLGKIHVGFALETQDEYDNAIGKLKRKNFDLIVLNSMRNEDSCFGGDNNQISLIDKERRMDFDNKSKTLVAKDVFSFLNKYY